MNVLVACEFSGIVRDAFDALGHNAWSCDVIPCEKPNPSDHSGHYQCNVLEVLHALKWDLLVAHPPCTYLCNSGVRWLKHKNMNPERWNLMYEAVDFFNALKNSKIPRICIENPIPHRYANEYIGPYSQLIQPWMFGHGETKATCLWLKNLPPLQPTHLEGDLFCEEAPTERVPRVHLETPGPNRWKNRSRTFSGVAKAMAAQWSNL